MYLKPDGINFFNIEQVCTMIGVHQKTLRKYIKEDRFPKPMENLLPRYIWNRSQIEEWSRI